MLDIIGITPEIACSKYNLGTIEKIIDQTCVKLLKRIIEEDNHPLTSKLNKVSDKSKAICRINSTKIRTKAYENSFVQKYLRTLRNGVSDIYTTRLNPEGQTQRAPPKVTLSIPNVKTVTTTATCSYCNKIFKAGSGIKTHIRLSHKTEEKQKQ